MQNISRHAASGLQNSGLRSWMPSAQLASNIRKEQDANKKSTRQLFLESQGKLLV